MIAPDVSRPGVVRAVDITALSPRAELIAVLRVGVSVVLVVALYLGAQRMGENGSRRGTAKTLLPYQSLAQDHGVADQRMFRMLQVALLEAENLRSATGAWPAVDALAAQGIDPFTLDPTNKGARYAWRMTRNGLTVNYLGIPAAAADSAPAWLLMILEPDRSAPPEAYQDDEEHARLLDGTLLHVSIWRHGSGARVAPALVRVPQAEGWSQVFAAGPSTAH